MKIKFKYISVISTMIIALIVVLTACEEEIVGPDTVPVKAEIKQIIVNNSVYDVEYEDQVPEDIDSVIVTVPQGTDITQLDLDILVSYFGSIEPQPGITDLTNPVTYTVTSNAGTAQVLVMANVVPPSLSTFLLTTPVQAVAKITGDSIMLDILDGIDLSNATFSAEFFGESVVPDPLGTIDLTADNPTVSVVNGSFESTYKIYVDYYGAIEFTGFIYDCTVHPNEIVDGAVGEDEVNDNFFTVEDDANALGGKVIHFNSLVEKNMGNHSGSANFKYAELGLDAEPDAVTVIFRGKGIIDAAPDRYFGVEIKWNNYRTQFFVEDVKLDISTADEYKYGDDPNGLDPTNWNIYRITANFITDEVKVYVNEDKDPIEALLVSMEDKGSDQGFKIGFGDQSSSNTYEGLYDYIIVEAGGAYSPEDLPLSDILPED